jgi:hypothetical protein
LNVGRVGGTLRPEEGSNPQHGDIFSRIEDYIPTSPRRRVPQSPRLPRTAIKPLLCVLVLFLGAGSLSGCGYYSFSGASIPSHLETIAIPIAQDKPLAPSTRWAAT